MKKQEYLNSQLLTKLRIVRDIWNWMDVPTNDKNYDKWGDVARFINQWIEGLIKKNSTSLNEAK
jgi:hypothetical protein